MQLLVTANAIEIQIFNYSHLNEALPFWDITEERFKKLLERNFSTDLKVSVIFVDMNGIHKLNKQYRGVDSPTDVLSFNYENGELGEVYISVDYILGVIATSDIESIHQEVLRITIHGILHLLGMEHEDYFFEEKYTSEILGRYDLLSELKKKSAITVGKDIELDADLEPMYVLQEQVLQNVLNDLQK